MNSRMVQGIFDDLNPETRAKWAYPDTGRWDADRNTREFIAAMPEWRRHGLLAFTLNLQGGSPEGYSAKQPWRNSAINADGSLRPDYLARTARILDRATELGMVVILVINTALAQGAFTVSELQSQQAALADQEQTLAAARKADQALHASMADTTLRDLLQTVATHNDTTTG
jgi:hypothetical protein